MLEVHRAAAPARGRECAEGQQAAERERAMIENGEAPQDPVLARVRPLWNDARTERNLSATLDRIEARSRRRRAWSRVMAGGAVVLLAGAVTGAVLHRARSTRE